MIYNNDDPRAQLAMERARLGNYGEEENPLISFFSEKEKAYDHACFFWEDEQVSD